MRKVSLQNGHQPGSEGEDEMGACPRP